MKNCILLVIIIGILSTIGCSQYQQLLKSNDYVYKLKMAKTYYAEKQYAKAEEIVQSILPAYKGTTQYKDIYLLYCMSNYYQNDYENAYKLFNEYLDNNQGVADSIREQLSFLKAYSVYKQILPYQLDQSSTNSAIIELTNFKNEFPESDKKEEVDSLIKIAKNQLEEKDFSIAYLYYQIAQYKAANIMFSQMIFKYSLSDNLDKYEYYKIESLYKYANKSTTARKEQRYKDVLAECLIFEQQFSKSKYTKEIKKREQETQELLDQLLKSNKYEPLRK